MVRTVFACLFVVTISAAFAADRPEGRAFATRSVTYARHGMVAAAHPLAVEIGLDVLKAGGSAIDAAIATNAALGFLEPVSCGLGGDLFAMVWDPKTEKLYGLNASGRAPAALTIDKVPATEEGTIPVYSVYSWTVPGCADGWFELHEKFGRLPMKGILGPAAEIAREGAPVPQMIASSWKRGAARFKDSPGFAEIFCRTARRQWRGRFSQTRPWPILWTHSSRAVVTPITEVVSPSRSLPSPTRWVASFRSRI